MKIAGKKPVKCVIYKEDVEVIDKQCQLSDDVTAKFTSRSGCRKNVELFMSCLQGVLQAGMSMREMSFEFIRNGGHITVLFKADLSVVKKRKERAMKIKVNRQELLRSWQIAMKYAASQTPNVALTGIRMIAKADDTLTLAATDMKRAVKRAVICLVDEPGEALLNAGMLGDMLKKSSAEWLTLETTEKRGTLTTEFSRMRFTIIPSASYPQLPSSQDAEEICEIDEADFVRLVVEGGNASSRPSEFPKYMGTCLLRSGDGKLIVVSTDGRRLSLSQSQCDVKMDMDLVVPASSLKDLVKDLTCKGTLQVKVDGAMMWFIVKGAEYSIRLIDTTFPKYEKILKDEYVSKLRVNRNALIGALDRIAVIANNTENRIMAMQLGSDLKLRARAAGLGTAQETISGVQLEGANLLIGFNVNFLLEGLKVVSTEDVLLEFSGEGEQVRIYNSEGQDFLYMLMPMNLSSQDISDDVSDDEVEC